MPLQTATHRPNAHTIALTLATGLLAACTGSSIDHDVVIRNVTVVDTVITFIGEDDAGGHQGRTELDASGLYDAASQATALDAGRGVSAR